MLLTATPTQVSPLEVWDLLNLLGLPPQWTEETFTRFFQWVVQETRTTTPWPFWSVCGKVPWSVLARRRLRPGRRPCAIPHQAPPGVAALVSTLDRRLRGQLRQPDEEDMAASEGEDLGSDLPMDPEGVEWDLETLSLQEERQAVTALLEQARPWWGRRARGMPWGAPWLSWEQRATAK